MFGGFVRIAVCEENPELIAAETGEGVTVRDYRGEDGGELLQELVADAVTAGVVDNLEFVEVQVAQGELAVA